MVLRYVSRKKRLYRRFELDIWGLRLLYGFKKSYVSKMFDVWDMEKYNWKLQKRFRYVYRIDIVQPPRVRKRQKWRFVRRRLSRLFYLTLSYSQFRKLARIAMKKEGSWESNYIMLIENRVISLLYRLQIKLSIFELRRFVVLGKVLIDNKSVTYYNLAVKYFEIVRFPEKLTKRLRYNLIERFKAGICYFSKPRYMYVNYKLVFCFVFTEPKKKDLVFPIKAVDVYRSSDYY